MLFAHGVIKITRERKTSTFALAHEEGERCSDNLTALDQRHIGSLAIFLWYLQCIALHFGVRMCGSALGPMSKTDEDRYEPGGGNWPQYGSHFGRDNRWASQIRLEDSTAGLVRPNTDIDVQVC